jgi:tripartite ATP-independent transporter DctP family solute receptor
MKKILSVTLMLLLSVVLLSAGGSSEKKAEGPKLIKEFKLGYINSPIGPMHEAAMRFGELLREATKGQYSVKVYPSSQLGNERELTEAVTLGTVDMTLSGPTPVSWYIPEYSMVNCPFIYKDLKHYMRVWDGEVGKFINGLLLEKKGLVVLDNWYRGPRYLTAKKEIKTLDDLKGLKIRVPEAEITLEVWKILGANPTPVPFNELFVALQQNVVVAQENPFEMIQTASLYDVQKFIMNTQHVASHYMLLIGDKQLKGLPEDAQKAIRETAVKAGEYQDKLMMDGESTILKALEAKGMKFVEMDPKPWKELVLKQIPVKFAAKYKMDIFEKILKTE